MPCGSPNDPVMISLLAFARMALGVALVHRQAAEDRDRGQKRLADVSEVLLRRRYFLFDRPIVDVYLARERARRGDRDNALAPFSALIEGRA